MPDVLPSSLLKTPFTHKGVKVMHGIYHVPVFCLNCGKLGLWVPEPALEEPGADFVGYLCPKCVPTYGEVAGLMVVPDEVFIKRAMEVQQEEYGRQLTNEEVARELDDVHSPLYRLKRDRKNLIK